MPVAKKQNITKYTSKEIYSIGEAAKYLGKSIMTLRRWVRDGKISCIRTKGGFRRFTHDELEKVKKYGPEKKSPLVSTKKASQEIGVSKQTLKRWAKKGKIDLLKDKSNHLYISKEEIEKNTNASFYDFFDHSIFHTMCCIS